uniref:5'-3' exonuclease domain-containing protein n=1 Tax=viral metagenome TaxID=1070528 RepID=A0A6C0KUS9_9ZZZZ
MNSNSEAQQVVLFIDGSYLLFHRYHSLINWWKNSKKDTPLLIDEETKELHPDFIEKFRKTLPENIAAIPHRLALDEPFIVIGKDCNRESIWRNEFCENYKGTRPRDKFYGAPLFKIAYEEELFKKGGVSQIISHPKLEADDCIAISTKLLLEKCPNVEIYIVTSDKDYLQLAGPRVKIFDLAINNLSEKKSSLGDAEKDLFCKIVMGDLSDNISSVLYKCGPKTALKCFENKTYFEERLKNENAYEKFELNRKIIDFDCIPNILSDEFIQTIITV